MGGMLEKNGKIYIAGHRGMVGSAILRNLQRRGFSNFVLQTHAELDLTNQAAVADFFAAERPDYVFLAAAKVGGIVANNTYPADFFYDNIAIETNVIHSAYVQKVKKLAFLGSSCIYPKLAPQPMTEAALLTGLLEPTNEAYAIAKIAGIKMCQAYRRQYGFDAIAAMPTNLYGPGDNFHPQNSHVLPALIRRFHEAKASAAPSAAVWGSGNPRREFLYVDDLADALLFLMQNYSEARHVNVGCGEDMTIRELARMVADVVGYAGAITTDPGKPDGTPQKLLDVSKLTAMGWKGKITLSQGIPITYQWFCNNVR